MMKVKIWPFGLGYLHGGGAEDLLDLHLVVSAIWESREARLEAALVFNKPSQELVDFCGVQPLQQPFLQQPSLQQPSLQQETLLACLRSRR